MTISVALFAFVFVFVSTHPHPRRLSTVRSADRIFVVKSGQVVEEGTHDDLAEREGGVYSGLIRRQLDAQRKLDASASGSAAGGGGGGVDESAVVDESMESSVF